MHVDQCCRQFKHLKNIQRSIMLKFVSEPKTDPANNEYHEDLEKVST